MLCAKGLSVEFGLGVVYVVVHFIIWKNRVGVSVTGIFPSAPVFHSLPPARGAHCSTGLQSQIHGEGTSELGLSKSLRSPRPPRGGLRPSSNTAGSSWGAVTKQQGSLVPLVLRSVNPREPGKDW